MLSVLKKISIFLISHRNCVKFDAEELIIESQGKLGIGCGGRNHPLAHISAHGIPNDLIEKIEYTFRDPNLESVEKYSASSGKFKTGLKDVHILLQIVDCMISRSFKRRRRRLQCIVSWKIQNQTERYSKITRHC